MSRHSSRIPTRSQILPVYAVIVLILYSWTIGWFFWKLPGWLYYLNVGEILTMYAYSAATNAVESLLVLCLPLTLVLILPKKWFYDTFVARGACLVMAGLGYMMFLGQQLKNRDDYPSLALPAWSLILACGAIVLSVFIAGRLAVMRKALEWVAEQATIFLYIYVPLSIVSVLVVAIRSVR